MSSVEVSLARTSVVRGEGKGLAGSAADCGPSLPGSLARWDRVSCSWRTAQYLLFEEGCELLATLPGWGMTVGGGLWELTMPEHLTGGSGSGLLLPTPSATSYGTNQGGGMGRVGPVRPSLQTMAKQGLWPTPNSRDWKDSGPTQGNRKSPNLGMAVWSTPTARDAQSLKKCMRGKGSQEKGNEIIEPLVVQVGGSLNPTWVEWLMGWPLGWTSLEPLAMDKFRQWRRSHGEY